ncbi:MAG TPA: thiamine pyrophosphate-binding protein [Acidimicrobiales bacterium]|nr:thiamine pyrophosphate-binding protein [Acidimicrobiales bacterium]
MSPQLGRDVLLEVLRTEGVRHIFGNPGSTELPFMDALADATDLRYVLALQEATAVAMADGYAQATRRPAFLNLHTSAGLGNAIGNLTNAQANRTPLVVTAGQQDYRHIHHDPLLSGDLVGLARTTSKWAHELRTPAEMGTILRRAFQDAASPPAGPVFVSLPMNFLEVEVDDAPPPPSGIRRRAVADGLDELADLLVGTPRERLAIIAGDEVAESDGLVALVALAEALAVRVHGAPLHPATVFPTTHALWAGPLPPAASAINAKLASYDRVLLIGGNALMVYPYTPGPALPQSCELLQISADPHQLGHAWPVGLGLVGDPRATLEALVALVTERVDTLSTAAARLAADRARTAADEERERAILDRYGDTPVQPAAAVHALLRALPDDTVVVDEAITTGTYIRAAHRTTRGGRYFFAAGGGLGWGMPAAVGVSLGYDRDPVVCVVGDGSAMYSPQALWTAAREQLPVLFVVVNNRQYLILKNNLRNMAGTSASTDTFVGMDLDNPEIDYQALARSMGVAATHVEKASEIGDAARAALATGRPHLLEIPIAAP